MLAACDFNMNFTYVLPGWEGSAHDSRVLDDAMGKGFSVPQGHHYLADAGYSSNLPYLLVPYQKVRYHLKEQLQSQCKPQDMYELFNLRHASLRNVVERIFGVLKARFRILLLAPRGYSLETQVKVLYALTAAHNFMNSCGQDPWIEKPHSEADDTTADTGYMPEYSSQNNSRRDDIARLMWREYQVYLGNAG